MLCHQTEGHLQIPRSQKNALCIDCDSARTLSGVRTTGDVSVTSSLTGTVEAADVVYVYAKAGGDVTA